VKDSKTEILIEKLETTQDRKFVMVKVRYDKGGLNMFQNVQEPRGYFLSATPEEHKDGFTTFTAFSGLKTLIEPGKRFSRKVLEGVAARIKSHEKYQKVIDEVVAKNKLTLKKAAQAATK